MICPFCGKEMINGFVSGGTQVVFSKKRKYSVWATDDDIVISRHNLTGPVCVAYHCPECKRVIIDYEADYKEIKKQSSEGVF